MKKFLISTLMIVSAFVASADEGMWLPHLLGQQIYDDMVKKGLKLSKDQLYNINKASLKDAIVIFGRGCTGGVVSSEGLVFTNHHCGYDEVAHASTVQNNFLKNGFYAKSKSEEIPAPGLTVQFLIRIDDVTKEMDSAIGKLTGLDRVKKEQETMAAINERYANPGEKIAAKVIAHFKGNQYLAFVYQTYNDIRMVGIPPENVGKFGGDTDNWEWPRHTGDFAIWRIYMGKDGKPADHNVGNVPYKPKYVIPVSLKGVKEGDFSMIWGYPGSTNRYESSYGVKLKTDVENPTLVSLREMRLKHMFDEMKKNEKTKLKLAPSYATIANYWKFYDGETKQLLKYKVFEQKQAAEAKFQTWATGKAEFENIFSEWSKAYDKWKPYAKHRMFLREGILGSTILAHASTLMLLESELVKKGPDNADVKKLVASLDKNRETFLSGYEEGAELNIIRDVMQMFYNEIDKNQHPIGFYEGLRNQFGDLKERMSFQKFAQNLINTTMLTNNEKWKKFVANPDAVQLQNDPAFSTVSQFLRNYDSKFAPMFRQFSAANLDAGRTYLKGVAQMEVGKKRYPDATFTMRVSYGSVKPYKPRDAVSYDYVTTVTGVMEKYKPGDYEFDLTDRYKDLVSKKDFGQFKDPVRNNLVVAFTTNNDITGGNSGSPVINANGELIGLAFDGNYEALSHQIAFDKDLNRTICVDIRYVLWCVDKLGGGGNLVSEMKLVR